MRWLLVKDLQILRRSPLLVALLVIYPIAIAVLIGVALSAGPSTSAARASMPPATRRACSKTSIRSASQPARRRSRRSATATRWPRW